MRQRVSRIVQPGKKNYSHYNREICERFHIYTMDQAPAFPDEVVRQRRLLLDQRRHLICRSSRLSEILEG